MENRKQITLILLAVVLMAALAVGCGSSSSSSSSPSPSANSTTGSTSDPNTSDETEASKEFVKPGGENKFAKFGQEADAAEREAASEVLEVNLQARAVGNWAAQCSSLSVAAIKKVEESAVAPSPPEGCAKALEAQAEPLSSTKEIRSDTMTGPIAALRIEGNNAFALYHGTKGVNYAMPMSKEGDQWKVDALVTQKPH
jgi:hypothetical protein